MRTILPTFVAACLVLVTSDVVAQTVAQEREISLKIESETLAGALDQWAAQTGVKLFSPHWEIAQKIAATPLKGSYTARQALDKLLSGTPLRGHWMNEKAVAIRQEPRVPPTALQSSGGDPKQADLPIARFTGETSREQRLAANDRGVELSRSPISRDFSEVEEVVVTGTHVRGSVSASPLISIDRENIKAGGFTSFQQLVRTIPQAHSGGAQQDSQFAGQGTEADNNLSGASGINLRGLGSRSTLVLLNGRRLPPADRTSITDASLIPLSVIERVDVLPDGASAIYGSDAVGGVVNIITRRRVAGGEASAGYGAATRGGYDEMSAGIAGGLTFDAGSVVFDYTFRDQSNLSAADRDFSESTPAETWLFPEQRVHALYSGGEFNLGQTSKFVFDVYASQRESELVYNAFGQAEASSRARQYGGSFGFQHSLTNDWRARLDLMLGKNDIDDRSLGLPEDITQDRHSAELLMDGPVWEIPGGPIQLALGVSYRHERYDVAFATLSELSAAPSRNVRAAFSELTIPLVGAENAIPAVRRLQLSLAARHEDYTDFGQTTDPRYGLVWGITDQFSLRSTYGTSFRAPTLFESRAFYELDVLLLMPDPSAASGETLTLLRGYGSNPELRPETARTWTVGFDFQPEAAPQLRLSATYFNIAYDDRIDTAIDAVFDAFPLEPFYPQLFDRTPDPVLVADLTSRPLVGFNAGFLDFTGLPFDPADIGAVIDNRFQNIEERTMDGVDVSVALAQPIGPGVLDATVNATYLLSIDQVSGVGAATLDLLDTVGNPVDLKLRGDVNYTVNDITLHTALNFIDGYRDATRTPEAAVSSWLTFDLGVSVVLRSMGGLQVSLAASNVFDREPPKVLASSLRLPFGYDPANASPVGRFVTATLRKRF